MLSSSEFDTDFITRDDLLDDVLLRIGVSKSRFDLGDSSNA